MKRKIIIKTYKEAEVSVEELYEIRREAFQQWKDIGLDVWEAYIPIEEFRQLIRRSEVYVAQDEATGELLAMRTLILHKKKGYALEGNFSVSPKAKRQGVGSKLFEVEQQRLREKGYRYVTCTTAIPATWSVQWHLKNGYYIVGYSRSERNPRALLAPTFRWENYASYVFRKQIATDVRHHPTDLLWTKPIAPVTAKIRYCLSWLATNICKSKSGKLNWIGRMAKRSLK